MEEGGGGGGRYCKISCLRLKQIRIGAFVQGEVFMRRGVYLIILKHAFIWTREFIWKMVYQFATDICSNMALAKSVV